MLQFEENDQATKVNSNTFIPKPNIVRIDYNKVLSALHTHIHVQSVCSSKFFKAGCDKDLLHVHLHENTRINYHVVHGRSIQFCY